MLERLERNPDKPFQIMDDEEAKVLLFELGLIDKFAKKVDGLIAPTEAVTGECMTHYILALLFSGRTKPDDNGYIVYCFPKTQCSSEKAREISTEILRQHGPLHTIKTISKISN